ncbi:MAG: FAD-binding oxidoreductase [Amaricoccus sp.]
MGAGFAGVSAARRLSQLDPTLRVVVLEAGVVGNGPAGRNSGFIIDLPHEVSSEDYGGDQLQKSRDHITLQRRAVDFAKEPAAERQLDRDTLDPCGRYNLALTAEGDHHLAAYAAQLDRLGEAHTMLDAKAVAEITGSPAHLRHLHARHHRPTRRLRPALADSLPRQYASSRTPATAIERQGAGWLVRTPQGSIASPRVVLANNGYADGFGFSAASSCTSTPTPR